MDGNGEQDEPAAKPKLRPANENPWYLLATIYGEQPEGDFVDWDLHARNRRAWNRYIAGSLTDVSRDWLRELMDKDGSRRFSEEELTPFTEEELDKLRVDFSSRGGTELPSDSIDFSRTEFDRPLIMASFIFANWTIFAHAVFSGWANFASTAFPDGTAFFGATFSLGATFRRATFSLTANFLHATFSGNIDFVNAIFVGSAPFAHVTFADNADFDETAFSDWVTFERANFLTRAYFARTIFSATAHFFDTKFQGPTSFADTKFKKHPPSVHHAALREDTQWHGATWPEIPSDSEEAQEHLYNYERLKQEMERLKKQEDEQFFFTKELQCREVVDGFPKNLISKAYGLVSFYGRSILRPLCGLGFAWLAGLLLLWPLGRTGFRGLKFTEAFGLSFYNLFPFLPYRKEIYTQGFLDELSRLAHIVAAWQAFAGAALLFLIGLALRNRFRMK